MNKQHLASVIVSIILLVCSFSVSIAENADLSSMTFEDLSSLKTKIDLEYNSRPESKGLSLSAGRYVVGEDVLPGQYYIAMVEPDPFDIFSYVLVFENAESANKNAKKQARFESNLFLGDPAKSMVLQAGNVIVVSHGSVRIKTSEFTEDEYFKYQAPEGTFVPQGSYIVGVDIPVGKYNVYAGSVMGGKFRAYGHRTNDKGESEVVYRTMYSGINTVRVLAHEDCQVVNLHEDDIVMVSDPIIMQKAPALVFE